MKTLVKTAVFFTLYNVNVKLHKQKSLPKIWKALSGPDGTRTRDLCRDRAAF